MRRYIANHLRGSSPRVWGQAVKKSGYKNAFRIIPTRVGTSGRRNYYNGNVCGSSPRVWGQVNFGEVIEDIFRIIPTRVGTSVRCRRAIACVRDHPHACGDKRLQKPHLRQGTGSSPRVWGQEKKIKKCEKSGIIPTRVGTSDVKLFRLA